MRHGLGVAEFYVIGCNMGGGGRNGNVVYSEIWEVRVMERSGVQREEHALISRENEMHRYLKSTETQRWRKYWNHK
jgi:hypothetical protein